ncbi:hypothetical protein [Vibrio rotiferianus]|uniref:hypothetical protein n=1 Tax=Vibrio rotiferianus TaxID=190895 RepID=UPI00023771E1|nr:hypothetical protein [Vibrio rotiferianus]
MITTYKDQYTNRVREVKQSASRHWFIREVVAGMPSKWQRMTKANIDFVLQESNAI